MANEINTTPATVANAALQALPFGQIIGGPLKACIDAQSEAALSTWNFINSVGITRNDKGEAHAVYVKFSYRSNGRSCSLSIPLLTLVPIPYLAIKDINIAFKAKISASSSVATATSTSQSTDFGMKIKAGFNIGIASASTEMTCSVSSKKDSSATRDSKYSVEHTIDVNITAGQEDMPAGMSKVLEILNGTIETIDNDGELMVSATAVSLSAPEGASVFVTYKDPEGYFRPKQIKADGAGAKVEVRGNGALVTFASTGTSQVSADGNSNLPAVAVTVIQ